MKQKTTEQELWIKAYIAGIASGARSVEHLNDIAYQSIRDYRDMKSWANAEDKTNVVLPENRIR